MTSVGSNLIIFFVDVHMELNPLPIYPSMQFTWQPFKVGAFSGAFQPRGQGHSEAFHSGVLQPRPREKS